MNKKKRIKELKERVASLERRIEVFEARSFAWDQDAPQPHDPCLPCIPVYTLDGTIVGRLGQCPIP